MPRGPNSWAKGIALAAIPLELFAMGYVIAPDKGGPRAAAALRVGPVEIARVAGWVPTDGGRGLERLGGGRIIVASPAEPPGGPVTAAVELGGATALAYGPPADRTYLFTLADGGHVAIACREGGEHGCASVLAGTRVTGAVEPSPTPEAAAALGEAMRELTRTVGDAQPLLTARQPAARARGAEQLAGAYGALSRELGGDRLRRVRVAALDAAAAFTRLAAAAADEAPPRYARAAAAARAAHGRLRAALQALGADGWPVGGGAA